MNDKPVFVFGNESKLPLLSHVSRARLLDRFKTQTGPTRNECLPRPRVEKAPEQQTP